MNQQLPDKVLRELVRGASKIYQNMCYGSMVTGDYNSAEAISKTMSNQSASKKLNNSTNRKYILNPFT